MGFLTASKNRKKRKKIKRRAVLAKAKEQKLADEAIRREEGLREAERLNSEQEKIVKKIKKEMLEKNNPDIILEGKRGLRRRGLRRKTNTAGRRSPRRASKATILARAKMKRYNAQKAALRKRMRAKIKSRGKKK